MSDITTTPVQNPGPITGSVLFYKQPEPLNPEMHGKLGVKQMESPFGFARDGHAVPLTVGEFPLAAFQFREFLPDLAGPESAVKRPPAIEGRENRDPFLADADASR